MGGKPFELAVVVASKMRPQDPSIHQRIQSTRILPCNSKTGRRSIWTFERTKGFRHQEGVSQATYDKKESKKCKISQTRREVRRKIGFVNAFMSRGASRRLLREFCEPSPFPSRNLPGKEAAAAMQHQSQAPASAQHKQDDITAAG